MSPLQHKIYQFIKKFLAEHGYSPSLLEIAKGVGISPRSKGLVSRYVHKLVSAGVLTFESKGYRNINLPHITKLQLPLEGTIAAGHPTQQIKENKLLDLNPVFSHIDSFALTIEGDSLINDGILPGDKLICHRQSNAREGAIIIAIVDDQHPSLKRIHSLDEKTITLKDIKIKGNSAATYTFERIKIEAVVAAIVRLLH